ncbi:MAG: 50S ribosomal protein L10 [Acidimicrobiales bacterium]
MRTSGPRPEKVAVVDEVTDRLSSASAVLLTEYRGLTVGELAALRKTVAVAGGDYRIYRNTLARRGAEAAGVADLGSLLTGPTAMTFVAGDAVAVAKALKDFARTNPKLVVKGGLLGNRVMTAGDATGLADVAPREVQLARLAGALAAPMRQMAGLLAAVPTNFAYGLSALIDKGGAQPAQPGSFTASHVGSDSSEVTDSHEGDKES